jgi:hypothetical protein
MPPDVESAFGNGPGSLSSPNPNPPVTPQAPAPSRDPAGMQMGPATITNGTGPAPASDKPLSFAESYAARPAPGSSPSPAPAGNGMLSDIPSDIAQKASLARDPNTKAAIFNKIYGPGSSIVDKDGNVLLKKPGETSFSAVDSSVSDFLGDLWHANLVNAGQDANRLVDQNMAGIKQVGQAVAGSAIAGGLGTMLAPETAGVSTVMSAAGSAAATYAASVSRTQALNEVLGQKNDPEAAKEIANREGLTDLILNAGGHITLGAVNKLAVGAMDAVAQTPERRAYAMVKMENELSEAASSFGSTSVPATGEAISSALDTRRGNLGAMYIGKYDTMVEQQAQAMNQKVPMDGVMGKMKDLMQPYVQFDGATPIAGKGLNIPSLYTDGAHAGPASAFDDIMAQMPPEQAARIRASQGLSSPGQMPGFDESFNGGAPFGSDKGRAALQTMLNDYAYFQKAQSTQGGLDVSEFRDFEKLYGNRGSYDSSNPFAGPTVSQMRQVDKSFSDTRGQFYQGILGQDTPAGQAFQKDWAQYGNEKDAIDRLYNIFGNDNKSASLMVDRVLSTNNIKPIQDLKTLFGSSNPEVMNQLKGAVIQKAMSDNTSGAFGVIDLQGFARSLGAYPGQGYSKAVLNEIYTPTELNQLRATVNTAAKIFTGDLNPDKASGSLGKVAGLIASVFSGNPSAMSRNFYGIFSGNEKAWNYLMENDLPARLAIANKAGDFEKSSAISNVIANLTDYRALSVSMKVGNRSVIVPTPVLREALTQSAKNTNLTGAMGLNGSPRSQGPVPSKGKPVSSPTQNFYPSGD